MSTESMVSTLKSLKLYGMADTIATLSSQSSPAYQNALPVLEMLLKAESSERDVRSINYQMKVAKFPGNPERGIGWRPRNRKNALGHRYWCSGNTASSLASSLPIYH